MCTTFVLMSIAAFTALSLALGALSVGYRFVMVSTSLDRLRI